MLMKTVGFYKNLPIENEESLVDLERTNSIATGTDLLIEIKAISVNPVDTKIRQNTEPQGNEPIIAGWDASGIVVGTGEDCTSFTVGDEVYYAGTVSRDGTNSAFHLVEEALVGRKPSRLSFAEAAALPLTTITAWETLFERMKWSTDKEENKGKSILIIGAAGGVGSIAIQLAHWAGLKVVGTASREESKDWARSLGADQIIDPHTSFLDQMDAPVDSIFCCNNTDEHWDNMIEAIAPQGHIVTIVEPNQKTDLNSLKSKSLTVSFEFMFTRSLHQTADRYKQQQLLNQVSQLIDEGLLISTLRETLRPINAHTLRKAHTMIERGKTIGKVVIEGFYPYEESSVTHDGQK